MARRIVVAVLMLVFVVSSVAIQAKTPLVVTDWWGADASAKIQGWFKWVETEFEKRNPDIDLQFQFAPWNSYLDKLVTSAAGGAGPDVAQMSVVWARDLYQKDMLLELNSFVAKSPDSAPKQFVPTTQVYNQLNGKIFGITFVMDSGALFYNKDHFAAAGLNDEPYALATWNDFISAAKKLTRSDGNVITRSGYTYWPGLEVFTSWLYSNGGAFYNEGLTKSAVNTKAGLETLQLLQDIYVNYGIFRDSASDFASETTSMSYMGTWSGSYLDVNSKVRYGVTSQPKGPSGAARGTTTWGNMWSIMKGTKRAEEAWRYIQFVTGLEAQVFLLQNVDRPTSPRLDFYRSPAWREAVRTKPYLEPMPEIAQVGGPMPFIQSVQLNGAAQPLMDQLAAGTIAPAAVLTNLEKIINQYTK